jgi:hypothetical protein
MLDIHSTKNAIRKLRTIYKGTETIATPSTLLAVHLDLLCRFPDQSCADDTSTECTH